MSQTKPRGRRILGAFTLATGVIAAYAIYKVVLYLLRLEEGNISTYTFHMEVLVASALVLTLVFALYESYVRASKR